MRSFFGFGKKKRSKINKPESPSASTGLIGRFYENDLPVIVKFNNEFPDNSFRAKHPMLTVVSWIYKGEENNGMPLSESNNKMMRLEQTLETVMDSSEAFLHAYSRTGNNLKELCYYSTSQDDFMKLFNAALAKQERYPIEINFFEDEEWSELKKLIAEFKE